uniref:Lipocalin n=1 Tax=Rhipicephalus zambeziensis TaxID=60191 RepID=A0A224YEI6_9ACAR
MATVTALIFSILAVAEASLELHELALNPRLSPYQDPSKFIRNSANVYLLRASAPKNTSRDRTQTFCVRSRYWSNTTEEVERSVDVYNRTDHSIYNSMNISLTVRNAFNTTLLHVHPNDERFSVKNGKTANASDAFDHEFIVLFSDANCLILTEALLIENAIRRSLRCFMWLQKHRITKPPKCCQFVFEILCAYQVDVVEFFDKSCLNATAPSPSSGERATTSTVY